MLRYVIFFAAVAMTLSSCSSDDEAAAPTCVLAPTQSPPEALTFSTAAHSLHLPLNQKELAQFMWVEASQAECYLQHHGAIQLSKILSREEASPDFVSLKAAADDLALSWKKYEEALQAPLMGLTTVRYYNTAAEELIGIFITLKDNARPWHLWHEYAHALIGQARAKDLQQSLRIPSQRQINETRKRLLEMDSASADYARQLQTLFAFYQDHIVKMYIDEMVIEATLIHLIAQTQNELPVGARDFLQSAQVITFFEERFDTFMYHAEKDLDELKAQVTTDEIHLAFEMNEARFEDLKRKVKQLAETSTSEATLALPD